MPIQFLKNVQSEENNLLSNRREPISMPSKAEPDKPYVYNDFDVQDHTLSDAGQSLKVKRVRVLKRTGKDPSKVFDKPEAGQSFLEDYYYKDYKGVGDGTTAKKQICLHFTAGGNSVGWLTRGRWAGETRVGVAYILSTTGTIFELYDDKYWGHSSNAGRGYNPHVVAIEIANPGPLVLSNGIWKSTLGSTMCTEAEGTQWVYTLPKPYREYKYFLRYTPEQYEGLRQLLAYLTAKHKIPYEFLPDDRPDTPDESTRFKCLNPSYKNLGYRPGDLDIRTWKGVVSHVNWAGKSQNEKTLATAWLKWDIGPAFEWDELKPQPRLAFPLQKSAQAAPCPASVYHNNESGPGGNYVVGGNYNIHSGIHLFPAALPQTVRSMAPGVIVAARLAKSDATDRTLKLTNNYNGFVLVRHNVCDTAAGTTFPIYSLYMHLAYPGWEKETDESDPYAAVPWMRRLLEARSGVIVDARLGAGFGQVRAVKTLNVTSASESCEVYKPGTFTAEPFKIRDKEHVYGVFKAPPEELADAVKALKDGKIITFHVPYFLVAAGEVIGHLAKPPGAVDPSGFLHWEVFSPTAESGLRKLLPLDKEVGKDILDKHLVADSGNDNYLDAADFAKLFAAELSEDEKELIGAGGYGAAYDKVRRRTASTFGKDIPADMPPPASELAYGLDLVIKKSGKSAPSGTYKLLLEFMDEAGSPLPKKAPWKQELEVAISDKDLTRRITVPAGTVKIVASSKDLDLQEGESPAKPEDQLKEDMKLFKDLVGFRLRNVLLQHVTEWSEAGIKSVYDKTPLLKSQFKLEEITPTAWWARTSKAFGEAPLRGTGSIFGAKGLLPQDGKIDNLHPVTALWLLWLLQKYGKVSFGSSPDAYTGHDNPELMYLGWARDPKIVTPALGDSVGVLVIRKDYNSKASVRVTARGAGTELSLGSPQYRDGVATLVVTVSFWGLWQLKANSSSASGANLFEKAGWGLGDINQGMFGDVLGPSTLEVPAPGLDTAKKPELVTGKKRYTMRLGFAGPCPREIEGIVFFRCYLIPKAQVDKSPALPPPKANDPRFVLCKLALLAVCKRDPKSATKPPMVLREEGIVELDPSMLVDDFAAAVKAAEGDRVIVSAGFYAPNGGDLALAVASDYKSIDASTVELQAPIVTRLTAWKPGTHGVGVMPKPEDAFLKFDNLAFGPLRWVMGKSALVVSVQAGSVPGAWKDIKVEMRCNDAVLKSDRQTVAATKTQAAQTTFSATLNLKALKDAKAIGAGTQAKLSIKIVEGSTLGYSASQLSETKQVVPKLSRIEIIDPTKVLPTHPSYASVKQMFERLKKPAEHVCLLGTAQFIPTDHFLIVSCLVKPAGPPKPPLTAATFAPSAELSKKVVYALQSSGTGCCDPWGYFGAWIPCSVLMEKAKGAEVKFVWSRPAGNTKVWEVEIASVESPPLLVKAS